MPWYGNATLAGQLATAVGGNLGDSLGGTNPAIPQAFFAYGISPSGSRVSVTFTFDGGLLLDCPSSCPLIGDLYYYAILGFTIPSGPSVINTQ